MRRIITVTILHEVSDGVFHLPIHHNFKSLGSTHQLVSIVIRDSREMTNLSYSFAHNVDLRSLPHGVAHGSVWSGRMHALYVHTCETVVSCHDNVAPAGKGKAVTEPIAEVQSAV